MYVRSVVEQSCVVWQSSLKINNSRDFERIQRVAVKIITNGAFSYKEGLRELNLPTLKERREMLCARFATKCLLNNKSNNMFKLKTSTNEMKLRHQKRFKETHTKTNRHFNSAIPCMQRMLNSQHKDKLKLLQC